MTPTEFKAALKMLSASFDAAKFPYDFLAACGKPANTIENLRHGDTNVSDIDGAVLQEHHIHIMGCGRGAVDETMKALRDSRATRRKRYKVRFLLASDGRDVRVGIVDAGKTTETMSFPYKKLHDNDHNQVMCAIAGIGVVKPYTENEVDERAARKLSELYVALMKNNPDWDCPEKRDEIHLFLARIVFCFFAEDTGVFRKKNIFTDTVDSMSVKDTPNTHTEIANIFRKMNDPAYGGDFRYVNGGLFAGSLDVPVFNKEARSLFLEIGKLEWTKINPDIFGSMIQTIASQEERSRLGMHYTSVPNIMRVLKPLFLDDLEAELKSAGRDKGKLAALRERMTRIRVFDPACGSGNFLVIAYKELRRIENALEQTVYPPPAPRKRSILLGQAYT